MRCTVSQGEPSIQARCWQQGGYALKKGGLDRQFATVVCRIIWTLSVCWIPVHTPSPNSPCHPGYPHHATCKCWDDSGLRSSCFPLKSLLPCGIRRHFFRQSLNRHVAPEPRIPRPIHLAHSARTARGGNFIASEHRSTRAIRSAGTARSRT
jgi:hypothetical protein